MRDYFLFLGILKHKTKHENKQNKTKNTDLLLHLPMLQKVTKKGEEWSHKTISTCINREREKKAKSKCDRLLRATVSGGEEVFSH